jgi:hypothetical protein
MTLNALFPDTIGGGYGVPRSHDPRVGDQQDPRGAEFRNIGADK